MFQRATQILRGLKKWERVRQLLLLQQRQALPSILTEVLLLKILRLTLNLHLRLLTKIAQWVDVVQRNLFLVRLVQLVILYLMMCLVTEDKMWEMRAFKV